MDSRNQTGSGNAVGRNGVRRIARPAPRKLDDDTKLAWLRLIRSENVGPVTFRDLVNRFGGAAKALEALPDLASRGGLKRRISICPHDHAVKELLQARRLGLGLFAIGEAGYPPWLAHIDAPPPLLYTRGNIAHLDKPIISIVGARNGSAVGRKFTRLLARDLGEAGFVIGSGLARGIDTAAHNAALDHGTIAVLAGGIDVIYPPENEELTRQIGERGLLISERQPKLQPRGRDFPRRNRIISGMAMGVVVIEAATRSGSLITARYASEQGREVFAVPGNPLDPRAEGTNRLLRGGATLVTRASDIVEALTPLAQDANGSPLLQQPRLDFENPKQESLQDGEAGNAEEVGLSARQRVLEALGATAVEVDELCRATGLEIGALQIILLELDLAGRLSRYPGQLVALNEGD